MEKLKTIQKREKLNNIYMLDNHHTYSIRKVIEEKSEKESDVEECELVKIQFQNGARKKNESIHGVIDTDLLEIVKNRLEFFQSGDFATRDNAIAITHIETALLYLNKRVEDRIEREVLGTDFK